MKQSCKMICNTKLLLPIISFFLLNIVRQMIYDDVDNSIIYVTNMITGKNKKPKPCEIVKNIKVIKNGIDPSLIVLAALAKY